MSEVVKCHGGPWHGRVVELEQSGKDHFHVLTADTTGHIAIDQALNPGMSITKREGMYSRVGKSNDFEWDGYRGHD